MSGAGMLRRAMILAAALTVSVGALEANPARKLSFAEIDTFCRTGDGLFSAAAVSVQMPQASSAPVVTAVKKPSSSLAPKLEETSQKPSMNLANILEAAGIVPSELEKKEKELLGGELADRSAMQVACTVALWQLTHPTFPSPAKTPSSSSYSWTFGPLSLNEEKLALGGALLAIALAIIALVYSRSATRRALRDAGLL